MSITLILLNMLMLNFKINTLSLIFITISSLMNVMLLQESEAGREALHRLRVTFGFAVIFTFLQRIALLLKINIYFILFMNLINNKYVYLL